MKSAWSLTPLAWAADAPVRLAVAGLVHGHASGMFRRIAGRKDVTFCGASDSDPKLRARYFDQFKIDAKLGFNSLDEMLDKTKPDGVMGFTNTFDHLSLIEKCAARKIPVMVEKPLAVSMEHASRIAKAAAVIPVLVNYETTWYSSNAAAKKIVDSGRIGEPRKFVVHDGHKGPKEIGVPGEFLAWLTNPQQNGAGALFDFGCYGANLITWIMKNQRPTSVTARLQTLKPQVYKAVDDEATVVLEYPSAQGIIQASWNWPFSRKDMEIYGRTGYVHTVEASGLRVRLPEQKEETRTADPLASPEEDYFSYFAAVIRKRIQPSGLSSIENNVIVTEILDAARQSAKTGQAVKLA